MTGSTHIDASDADIDIASLLGVVWSSMGRIFLFVLLALGAAFLWVNSVDPRYRSEARILIERGETSFTKPVDSSRGDDTLTLLDEQAVASQVQVISSRDLARGVARKLDLASIAEFDSARDGLSFLGQFLVTIGLKRDPLRMSAEERVLSAYYDRLTVYQVGKSRVIAVQFEASTPEIAAKVANAIAEEYVSWQRNAKRESTRDAADWLETEIAGLRGKVAEAEARVARYRSGSDLLVVGQNNTSLNAQQLSDLNTQLTRVRAEKSEARAKADQLRKILRSGRPLDASSELVNSPLIQRLQEQSVRLQARIAELSSTLLPGHPRIKELKAQLADLRAQIRKEAERHLRNLENDARIAAAREQSLKRELSSIKAEVSRANEQAVKLRALEREAKAQRDLLESFLRRYREATARQNAESLPADARIISRAAPASDPAFPKKIPILAATAIGVFVLGILAALMKALTTVHGLPGQRDTVPAMPRVPGEIPLDGRLALDEDETPPLFNDMPDKAASPAAPDRSQREAAQEDVAAPGASGTAPEAGEEAPPVGEGNGLPVRPIRSIADLLDRINASSGERAAHVIAVSGSEGATGIASTATALARVMAMHGRRVILVDADPHQSKIAPLVSVEAEPGIGELLRGEASFGDVIHRDRASRAHVITAGLGEAMDRALVSTDMFSTMLDALRQTYDHVIIDAGIVEAEGIAVAIAARADFAVLAIRGNANEPANVRAYESIAAACVGEIAVIATDPNTAGRRPARGIDAEAA